ncbi:DUF1918 domain-containing protein [Nocardia sp. NBC_00511]|uniref:DUF1918 domain-containing protein n=1 Tax=Nocardia sp. NBC_00511 TaxID=2903591 RepID=UPI0030DED3E3
MRAHVGDHLIIHGRNVGFPDHTAEIVEVHGAEGEPPYVVRFTDGRTSLMFPGADSVVRPG